jgi:hypothetical protein
MDLFELLDFYFEVVGCDSELFELAGIASPWSFGKHGQSVFVLELHSINDNNLMTR